MGGNSAHLHSINLRNLRGPNSSDFLPHVQSCSYISSPHCCGESKTTFTFTEYLHSSISVIVPFTIIPVNIHSHLFPIILWFISVVFISQISVKRPNISVSSPYSDSPSWWFAHGIRYSYYIHLDFVRPLKFSMKPQLFQYVFLQW